MPGQKGKKHKAAREKVDRTKVYELEDALKLIKDASFVKFDESVDVAVRLGVNPKHADQMVRGSVMLPHGTGKVRHAIKEREEIRLLLADTQKKLDGINRAG